MTIQQAADLLRSLFVTYPHLDTFVNGLPDPQATIDEWRRLVAKLNYDHAAEAIRRLKDGEADPPVKPWDVAMLPMIIRGVAGRVADDAAKYAKAEAIRAAKREATQRQSGESANAFNVARRIATSVRSCLVRGEISQARHDEIMDYVIGMSEQHADTVPQVPDDIRHDFDHPREICWKPGTPPLKKKIRNYH